MKLGQQDALPCPGHADIDPKRICYWKTAGGVWVLHLPGCGIGELRGFGVIEHQDGTISVTPSIKMFGLDKGAQSEAHGFLTQGKWRDA